MRIPVKDRLLKLRTIDENGCWIWTGEKYRGGYGRIFIRMNDNGSQYRRSTHRISYEIFKGEIPKGMLVCHKCDVKACFNPDHLFIGTQYDNVHDCINKGRSAHSIVKGGFEFNPAYKMNPDSVLNLRRDIKYSGLSTRKLAVIYGISQPLVSLIGSRKIWIDI